MLRIIVYATYAIHPDISVAFVYLPLISSTQYISLLLESFFQEGILLQHISLKRF